MYLSNEFLKGYNDFPNHMNEIAQFVYYRTYSRFLPEKGRRETWKETVKRSAEYNVGLSQKHLETIGYKIDSDELKREAELLFDNMFNLRQFLSGRTLWVGGAENGVADKYPLANFNCSFVAIQSWSDLGDLFYLLLVGTGVGFRVTKEMAKNLPAVRDNFIIENKPYTSWYPFAKIDESTIKVLNDTDAEITVSDSKEGWVQSLRLFFDLLTNKEYENITKIKFNYNYVRPKGERLKTFGGTASGPEPLMEMFLGFERVIKNQIDPALKSPERVDEKYVKLRPIHVLDMGNLVGNNVVVGGKLIA